MSLPLSTRDISDKPEILWVVLENVVRDDPKNKHYLKCRCACGVVKEVRRSSFGKVSFGCKKCMNAQRKHGMSKDRLYNIWSAMKQRCTNSNTIGWDLYGGRGIAVCPEWMNSFEEFKTWSILNGYKEHLTLDRKDLALGYSSDNCKWSTPHEQNRNQRSNVWHEQDGKRMILKDWCQQLNLNYSAVLYRIRSGKTIKEALSYPTRSNFNG